MLEPVPSQNQLLVASVETAWIVERLPLFFIEGRRRRTQRTLPRGACRTAWRKYGKSTSATCRMGRRSSVRCSRTVRFIGRQNVLSVFTRR